MQSIRNEFISFQYLHRSFAIANFYPFWQSWRLSWPNRIMQCALTVVLSTWGTELHNRPSRVIGLVRRQFGTSCQYSCQLHRYYKCEPLAPTPHSTRRWPTRTQSMRWNTWKARPGRSPRPSTCHPRRPRRAACGRFGSARATAARSSRARPPDTTSACSRCTCRKSRTNATVSCIIVITLRTRSPVWGGAWNCWPRCCTRGAARRNRCLHSRDLNYGGASSMQCVGIGAAALAAHAALCFMCYSIAHRSIGGSV